MKIRQMGDELLPADRRQYNSRFWKFRGRVLKI